jgi:hypothetical protein
VLHFTYDSPYRYHTTKGSILEMPEPTPLVNKFPAFYGTRRFITVFKRAHILKAYCFKIQLNIVFPSTPTPVKCSVPLSFPNYTYYTTYEGVSKSSRTANLERVLQKVQLSATRCRSIAILWVIIENFAAITLWRGRQRVRPNVSVYFFIDSVRKLLDTPTNMVWLRSSRNDCIARFRGSHVII